MSTDWKANMQSKSYPGGVSGGGTHAEPEGTLYINMKLTRASKAYEGRYVEVEFRPEELDVLARLVAQAIKARDEHATYMDQLQGK